MIGWQMKRFAAAIVIVILLVVGGILFARRDASGAGKSQASSGCEVGGNPSLHVSRIPKTGSVHFRSRVIVIACGDRSSIRFELVAFSTTQGLCLGIDFPAEGTSEGLGCTPNAETWASRCGDLCIVKVGGIGIIGHDKVARSFVSGVTSSETSRLQVTGESNGRRIGAEAVVSDIAGKTAHELHQGEPLSVFTAVLPRCVSPGSVGASAEAENGSPLGSAHYELNLPGACQSR